MSALTEAEWRALRKAWSLTQGRPWAPRNGTSVPIVQRLVAAGFLRITDGRCGFELIKNEMVAWTEAGRAALEGDKLGVPS